MENYREETRNQEESDGEDEEFTLEEGDIQEIVPEDAAELTACQDDGDMMDEDGGEDFVLEDDSVQGFFGHNSEPIYCISMDHSKGKPSMICSGGGDDMAYLWQYDTGEQLFALKGHTDSVVACSFNADGSYVATGGMDGHVFVWSTVDGSTVCNLDGPDEVVWLRWHQKGNILLAGSADGNVWMWFIPSGTLMHVFSKHTAPVNAGTFVPPDGKQLVTAAADASLVLWNPQTAEAVWRNGPDQNISSWHSTGLVSLAVSADGKLVATGDEEGKVRISSIVNNGRVVGSLDSHEDVVESLLFYQPQEQLSLLISASLDGKVHIWDLQSMSVRSTLTHSGGVNHIRLIDHHQRQLLVTSTVDKTINWWNPLTGELIRQCKGHQEAILTMDSIGNVCVSGGDDGVCLVFNLEGGEMK